MALTTSNIESIQIDYGVLYIDYGEVTERMLGPTRGGATLNITKELTDIEFDGRKGKTKGMQVVQSVDAHLAVNNLSCSMENLNMAMPWFDYTSSVITAQTSDIGVTSSGDYLTNVVMFAKLVGGGYKKITLYSVMNEADFSLAATPKEEGTVALELYAHWDPTDDDEDLFKIEDVETLGTDTTAPTATLTPANEATAIVVSADLTCEFSEAIKSADVTSDNFVLSTGGSAVAGSLTYNSSTFTVTFNPTSNLTADTEYTWVVSNVRDLAGNKMDPTISVFTTAA